MRVHILNVNNINSRNVNVNNKLFSVPSTICVHFTRLHSNTGNGSDGYFGERQSKIDTPSEFCLTKTYCHLFIDLPFTTR